MTRIEILQKLSTGELTVDEAERLLKEARSEPASKASAQQAEAQPQPETTESAGAEAKPQAEAPKSKPKREAGKAPRWLRIRVGDSRRETVRINIPLSLVNAGVHFGAKAIGDAKVEAWDEFLDAVSRGEDGTLVEVDDDGDGVRIYID